MTTRRARQQRAIGALYVEALQRMGAVEADAQLRRVAARGVHPVNGVCATQSPVGRDFANANRAHAVEVDGTR